MAANKHLVCPRYLVMHTLTLSIYSI